MGYRDTEVYVQEVEALHGWGEKCWRLREGVHTGAGPCRNTGLADMLVAKLVSAAGDEETEEGPKGSTDWTAGRRITDHQEIGFKLQSSVLGVELRTHLAISCV